MKNQWAASAYSWNYYAEWFTGFPTLVTKNNADKTPYNEKCVELLRNFLKLSRDFIRPYEMHMYLADKDLINVDIDVSVKNTDEILDIILKTMPIIRETIGSGAMLPGITFKCKTKIFMFDEKTGTPIRIWYPDKVIEKSEKKRQTEINKRLGSKTKNNVHLLEIEFDVWNGYNDIYKPLISIKTNSDIWLYTTFYSIGVKGHIHEFNNIELAKLNNEELGKILHLIEDELGGKIDFAVDYGDLKSIQTKYGFIPVVKN